VDFMPTVPPPGYTPIVPAAMLFGALTSLGFGIVRSADGHGAKAL
jgi:hypothetical protein